MKPLISVSEDKFIPPSGIFLKIYIFFRSFFDDFTGGSANFLLALAKYIYARVRMFFVLVEVLIVVIGEMFDGLKMMFTQSMFWGRSPLYRWSVQFAAVVLIGIFAVVQLYKKPQLTVTAQAVDVERIAVAENDLIVETGSTQTLIPKSRGRLDTLTYVVESGDTISGIAGKFGLNLSTILWANGLNATSVIKPGQTLRIPEGDGVLHRVKSGDTLSSIAKKYKSNEQAIAQVNWIDDPSQLPVGEVIFVPNGTIEIKTTVATKTSSGTSGGAYISGGGGGANPPGANTLVWPVYGGAGRVTQCPSWYHKAIDIADKTYPYIVSARSGVVVFAGVSDPYGYGREVIVSHGGGLYTQYAHLSAWAVTSGQAVSAGQIIGRMGHTGLATGTHLHFEVRTGCSSYACRVRYPQYYLTTAVCR